MPRRADVVVVGAGIAGSAAARSLARRGADVVLVEQYDLFNAKGSSHGGARIFRFAYPDPFYVSLARRALDAWRALEAEAGEALIDVTGGVDHGDEAQVRAVSSALAAAGCDHELLDPAAAEARYPGLRFEGIVCAARDTGRIRAERAWRALLDGARRSGAEIEPATPVRRLTPRGDRVEVHLDGRTIDAACVVVAAGAWVGSLLGDLVRLPPLELSEEHVFHFSPIAQDTTGWPSFIHYRDPYPAYGLLTPGEGVKVGEHHAGRVIDHPDRRTAGLDPVRRAAALRYVERWIPGVEPHPVTETTCLYTTTPNDDFVLDRRGPIVVASPCSGHGFKFAPLVGELVADLVDGAGPAHVRFSLPS